MHNHRVKNRYYAVRSAVLFVLLLGLFISSGEGLRLFPIPVGAVDRTDTQYQRSASNTTRYALAVQHSGSHLRTGKSKASKRIDLDAGTALLTGEQSETHRSAFVLLDLGVDDTAVLDSLFDIPQFLGRAPPIA